LKKLFDDLVGIAFLLEPDVEKLII